MIQGNHVILNKENLLPEVSLLSVILNAHSRKKCDVLLAAFNIWGLYIYVGALFRFVLFILRSGLWCRYSSGWPGADYVAKAGLKLQTVPLPHPSVRIKKPPQSAYNSFFSDPKSTSIYNFLIWALIKFSFFPYISWMQAISRLRLGYSKSISIPIAPVCRHWRELRTDKI